MKNLNLIFLFIAFNYLSCNSNKYIPDFELIKDYILYQPGRYTIYRLDSLVFPQAGRGEETHYYQEKNVVNSEFTDNSGRQSYRIFRYLRDSAGLQPWQSAGTYYLTTQRNSLEVVEDNMRIIKLIAPITVGNVWKGNRFLADEPYATTYSFSNDDNMRDWEFNYVTVTDTFTFKQKLLQNVISVVQVKEIFVPDTVDVIGNKAILPKDSKSVFIKGFATSTVIIEGQTPSPGFESVMIYNRTNQNVSFNNILVPPLLAFPFQYYDNKWNYENGLTIRNNQVTIPKDIFITYLLGTATTDIQINVSNVSPSTSISIYNKSNQNAYPNFNPTLNAIAIPPGYGRRYEYFNNAWRLYGNSNVLLNQNPYINELPLSTKSFSEEKYAKGIGLVQQELTLWEYQPNPGGTAFKIGFGVKRRLIDYN